MSGELGAGDLWLREEVGSGEWRVESGKWKVESGGLEEWMMAHGSRGLLTAKPPRCNTWV